MKIILTVLCWVALATFANTSSAIWGRHNYSDYRITNENVLRYPIRNNYQEVSVYFPKSGSNNRIITEINATDRFTNSSGAIPMLVSGGIGFKYATIKLRSQYHSGINSTVMIWVK